MSRFDSFKLRKIGKIGSAYTVQTDAVTTYTNILIENPSYIMFRDI